MAIQNRRGAKKDFDATKMLPGEIAVTTDGTREVYAVFAPGDAKKLASEEEVQAIVDEFNEDVEENIQKAADEIEQRKEEALAEIPNYEQRLAELEAYKANSILSKTSGEVVTTTDSAKVKPKNIKLFGKGKQRQYEGNQVVDYVDIANRFVKNENGKYTVTSTNGSYVVGQMIPIGEYLEANTQYTCVCYGVEQSQIVVCVMAEDNKSVERYCCIHTVGADANPKQFSVTEEEVNRVHMNLQVTDKAPTGTHEVWYTFNKGSEAKEWEPFVGNEPSPSINYPQEAEFLGESGSIGGKVLGENLINVNAIYGNEWGTHLEDSIKPTIDGDNLILEVLKRCSSIAIPLSKQITGIYACLTFSCSDNGSNRGWKIIQINGIMYGALMESGESWIANWDTNTEFARVQIECGDTWFEVGTTITLTRSYVNETGNGFTPYIVTQPFTFQTPNGLMSVPLYGDKGEPNATYIDMFGNPFYADYKDFNRNVQAITEIVLTGTEIVQLRTTSLENPKNKLFQILTDSSGVRLYNYLHKTDFMTRCLMSNSYVPFEVWNNDVVGMHLFSGEIWIRDCFETVEDFKAKLAELYANGTPVKVYAPLANPIITDTTEEEKAQLDKLIMNYPNTTIVNDEGAYMEVEYVCDTKEHIKQNYTSKVMHEEHESRIAELEKAIVNS